MIWLNFSLHLLGTEMAKFKKKSGQVYKNVIVNWGSYVKFRLQYIPEVYNPPRTNPFKCGHPGYSRLVYVELTMSSERLKYSSLQKSRGEIILATNPLVM